MSEFFTWEKPRLKVAIAVAATAIDFVLLSSFFLGFAVDILGGSLIAGMIYRPFHATIIPSVILFYPAILSRDSVPRERGLRAIYIVTVSLPLFIVGFILLASIFF